MNNQWLTIYLKNGDVAHYAPSDYTDYHYDGKCFIVIKNKQWIGIYNLDIFGYMEVSTVEDAERGNQQ